MAAILCTTIGELIHKGCQVLTIPCRACGLGCDKLGEIVCTPFMPYLVVTFALNTPAVVYAVKSFQYYACSYVLFRWLVVNAVLSIIHMIAAFYIVNLIREELPRPMLPTTSPIPTTTHAEATIVADTGVASSVMQSGKSLFTKASNKVTTASAVAIDDATATAYQNASHNNFTAPLTGSGDDVPGGADSFTRIKHVLCYDKGMAVYIVIFLTWMVWMAMGVSKRLFFDDGDNMGEECDELTRYMNFTIAIGYAFMAMVGAAFCCSLCCLR
mmetsp:Transcript_28997/g.29444  ORF Transcript_28997/g.29444 Transcript_28997/m.29444 type:complete len:271 (-) Transcript_28997:215-1027(-)